MEKTNISLLLIILIFFSCANSDCNKIIAKDFGAIRFRRSYANHLSMSGKQLDSVINSNPEFDVTFNDAKPELLQYLEKFGFANKNELFTSKVNTFLKDTLVIYQSSGEKYSIFPILDITTNTTFITITGKNCRDSIYLDESITRPRLRLIDFEPEKKKFILIYWEYYFMNGDMFNIALFETK